VGSSPVEGTIDSSQSNSSTSSSLFQSLSPSTLSSGSPPIYNSVSSKLYPALGLQHRPDHRDPDRLHHLPVQITGGQIQHDVQDLVLHPLCVDVSEHPQANKLFLEIPLQNKLVSGTSTPGLYQRQYSDLPEHPVPEVHYVVQEDLDGWYTRREL
jgi:hypothetical protein